MFSKMKNIDTALRHLRLFSIAVVLSCAIVCCYTIYKSYSMVSQVQSRIYILANGKALEAFAAGRKDNVPVEAKDHVKTFHQYFFTLDPDDKAIESGITKALYLADGTAKRAYDDLKENGYFASLISGNVNQSISVDSITVDISEYPYRFRCFATQNITRPTSTTLRSLVTEGALRNVSRSDNNPHGFLIEKWSTIENRDIKVSARH